MSKSKELPPGGYTGLWQKTGIDGLMVEDRRRELFPHRIMQMWDKPRNSNTRLLSLEESLSRPLIGEPIYFDPTVPELGERLGAAFAGPRVHWDADTDTFVMWDGYAYVSRSEDYVMSVVHKMSNRPPNGESWSRPLVAVDTTIIPPSLGVTRATQFLGGLVILEADT